jgi:hypothetical protein
MNYFDALKIYNEGKPAWCSPRRGTFEYKAVYAIMRGGAVSAPKSDDSSMSMPAVKPKRKYTRKAKAPVVDSGSSVAPAPKKRRGRPPKICYDADGNIIPKATRKPRFNRTPAVSSKKSSAPSAGSGGFFRVSSRSLPMTATSALGSKPASMMGSNTIAMARNAMSMGQKVSLPKSTPPAKRGVGRPRKPAGAPKQKYVKKPKASASLNVSAKNSPNTLFGRLMKSSTPKSGQYV